MNKIGMPKDIVEKFTNYAQKLGFGFSIGSGLTGFLFVFLSGHFQTINVDIKTLMMMGGVLGMGLNKLIDAILVRPIIFPLRRFITFYSTIGQILALKKLGIISEVRSKQLLKVITETYFISEENDDDIIIESDKIEPHKPKMLE